MVKQSKSVASRRREGLVEGEGIDPLRCGGLQGKSLNHLVHPWGDGIGAKGV